LIRLAKEEDFPRILEMTESFHRETPYKDLPFNKGGIRDLFDAYLRNPSHVIFLMFDHGMIAGMAMEPVFSHALVATELAWWVDHEHRKTQDSIDLMLAYEEWARRIGAKVVQMAMLDEVTNLDRFYRKQGYRPAERSYIKEL
jgi:GNAT superfamily N-acetyltransferase